jgi:hypothetical protein
MDEHAILQAIFIQITASAGASRRILFFNIFSQPITENQRRDTHLISATHSISPANNPSKIERQFVAALFVMAALCRAEKSPNIKNSP